MIALRGIPTRLCAAVCHLEGFAHTVQADGQAASGGYFSRYQDQEGTPRPRMSLSKKPVGATGTRTHITIPFRPILEQPTGIIRAGPGNIPQPP